MTRNDLSFVDPNTLALPSPSDSPESSTSTLPSVSVPSTSSSAKSRPHPITDGPPRKRSRIELTSEERKEARAHRNRIAAQNSRDRRKAQFAALEERISELETENRTLRASMGLTALRETEEQKASERARERENQELRDRIRTLESGWDAIVKALQTHGLPPGIPTATTFSQTQAPTPRPDEVQSRSTSPSSPSPSSSTTTFPVFVPPSPIFPLSPAPSHSSVSSAYLFEEPESTRHLARHVPFDINPLNLGLNTFGELGASPPSPIDEAAMEDLFREILAPSPTLQPTALPVAEGSAASSTAVAASIWAGETVEDRERERKVEAEAEKEMQRLLDMLPTLDGDGVGLNVDFPSQLDLDLGTWDFEMVAPQVF
ncbi:hypothetical protein EW146_g5438 [Bondarzewia mesenterica]|uniref:X-box-binding protein 1 n=1 Tax=Bondarzewia mesenterica TaxID=1095465 RepID=A0A4S4LTC3_9AGAM|nr:hypothetical protein EW146_g5438 [Bondarzewia mesenterica]